MSRFEPYATESAQRLHIAIENFRGAGSALLALTACSSDAPVQQSAMAAFPDTQWSMIRQSAGSASTRHPAFAVLAANYREAILSFYRQRLPANDAEDATQSFLTDSYEHAWWARARPELGSFRGFLLLLLRRDLRRRIERNDPQATTELPDTHADTAPDAAQAFDARFALILTQNALDRLRADYSERGRAREFGRLLEMLHSRPAQGEMQKAATELGMDPNTLTVNLKRLRLRLQETLRDSLRELCADQATFDREWREMQRILQG